MNGDYYDNGRLVRVPSRRLCDSDANILESLAHEADEDEESESE